MRALLPIFCLLLGSAGLAVAATLEVHTQPDVEVYWEGVLLATTDAEGVLVVEDVPEGPFELELRKPGYEPLATRVQIGSGSTRLTRELVASAQEVGPPVAPVAPVAAAPESGAEDPAGPGAPAFHVSTGGWVMLVVLLGLLTVAVARLMRARSARVSPPPPPPPPRVTRERASSRTFEASSPGGGTFLSELRQRERAMDDLVDVSGPGGGADEGSEGDVVDVAWKEID